MKVDILIPTKDPKRVLPKLLKVLRESPYVNNIIFETSKPLSIARKIGAMKCTTEWIAMFDDDVEIPSEWFEKVFSAIKPGVVAISTVFEDDNPHLLAFLRISNAIKPVHKRDSPFICNTLIRRDLFFDYDPPKVFYSEDEILYRHAKKKGKWVHLPYIGVKHHFIKKDIIQAAYIMEKLGYYPKYRWLRGIMARFLLSIPACAYSRTWRTILFFWKMNVENIAGVIKAKIV